MGGESHNPEIRPLITDIENVFALSAKADRAMADLAQAREQTNGTLADLPPDYYYAFTLQNGDVLDDVFLERPEHVVGYPIPAQACGRVAIGRKVGINVLPHSRTHRILMSPLAWDPEQGFGPSAGRERLTLMVGRAALRNPERFRIITAQEAIQFGSAGSLLNPVKDLPLTD